MSVGNESSIHLDFGKYFGDVDMLFDKEAGNKNSAKNGIFISDVENRGYYSKLKITGRFDPNK